MKKRTGVLLLLIALAIITFLDRLCISVAGPRMQDELHIDPARWGWILGAFVLSYGVFEIPTGALGDRLGQRRVLARIVLWWSVFTSLTGASRTFWQLLATRFLFGVGEAGAYPNASGVIARWFPPTERARAQGFVWAASRLGGALSPILVVPLLGVVGWRMTFVIFGAIGVVWVVVWRRFYRDALAPVDTPSHTDIPWGLILRSSQVWLIFVTYGCYAWGSWFYMAWLPTYLVRGAGFSESEMGIFSSFPFVLGVAGNVTGGFLSDRLVRKYGLKIGRRAVACSSLATSSLLIAGMAAVRNKTAIVVLCSLGFGVMDLMLPAAWAVCLDIGHEYSGVVTGIMNSSGQLGGFLCTVLFGYVIRASGSYTIPLFTIAGMVMTSAMLFSRIDPTQALTRTEVCAA
ncbi:MAG: MFS transporter [Acidobacteriaceae bacterium]|nr:MFS transporter [Acidobacteriaceae bacterium]